MGKVINADFPQHDNSGYFVTDGEVSGIYCGDLAASTEDNNGKVIVFDKSDGAIVDTLDIKQMNQFCINWLCMHDPDVIVEDTE